MLSISQSVKICHNLNSAPYLGRDIFMPYDLNLVLYCCDLVLNSTPSQIASISTGAGDRCEITFSTLSNVLHCNLNSDLAVKYLPSAPYTVLQYRG